MILQNVSTLAKLIVLWLASLHLLFDEAVRFLSVWLQRDGKHDRAAQRLWHKLHPQLQRLGLDPRCKGRLVQATVVNCLLYGCESGSFSSKQLSRYQTFLNRTKLVMFMNALSLARGDDGMTAVSIHGAGWNWWLAYTLQILTLVACMIAGMVFLARGLVRRRDPVAHDQDLLEGQVPSVDEADNDAGETSSDRWYRYKNCSMSECSDPEYWMELNHIELSSSAAEVDVGPNPVRDRLMEVLEGDYISNRAIASWLFSRVNRRLENVTDEADRVILTEMHYALSVGLINMTNGNLRPSFEQVRGIVLGQSNISYDADSPSASLSVAQMREEIIQSEVHATEHYNRDGSLHHVDQEGPMFGPQTYYDTMLDDIHERRARALEDLNGRLQVVYNHGPQE